jgi:hypothetical protein
VDVQDQKKEEIQIKLYPNPAGDFLNVWYRPKQACKKAVFIIADTEGCILKTMKTPGWEMTMVIPVRDFAPGVYFLPYLEDGTVRDSETFIKT